MDKELCITDAMMLHDVLDLVRVDAASHFHDWGIAFHHTPFSTDGSRGWFVYCTFMRKDINTGEWNVGTGRREAVFSGTTLSGVVKTCWLLVELLVRHELMEAFKYNGSRIFNPHHTVVELAEVQSRRE